MYASKLLTTCLVTNSMMPNTSLVPLNKSGLQVIWALQHAATDDQVHGFVAQMDQIGNQDLVSSLAGMQELRTAILRFRYIRVYQTPHSSLSPNLAPLCRNDLQWVPQGQEGNLYGNDLL